MSKKSIAVLIIGIAIIISGVIIFKSKNNNKEEIVFNKEEIIKDDFGGEKGEKIDLVNGKVEIDAELLNDGLARYYNVNLPNGDIVYFFVVKDKNGVYRAAANACQVCFGSKLGFRQEGENMICNTCGNAYPLEKIATEKGGCNPGPINPNLKVENGKIFINQSELEEVSGFFN